MPVRAAIYLDANASAPLSPRARDALLPLLTQLSAGAPRSGETPRSSAFPSSVLIPNPSSPHAPGRHARKLLNDARDQVAASLGLRDASSISRELTFTSSGTEANQMAIRAVLEPKLVGTGTKPHWVLTAGEHDATLQMARWFEERGGTVSFLPLGAGGAPRVELLEPLLRPETALVSAIWVNNETGVITDVAALARVTQARGIPLHLDGAQAWGKLPLDLPRCGAQLVSFSGHKIGALAGTGALWASGKLPGPQGQLMPGKQENSRRGGTENLLGAVALGAAASGLEPDGWAQAIGPLRDRLEAMIRERIVGARVHGAGAARVANTLNLGFEGVGKDGLVMALDLAGYAVSSGSACSSGVAEPSHVLLAMGLSEAQARSAVRISLSTDTTWEELEGFVGALVPAVARLRGETTK